MEVKCYEELSAMEVHYSDVSVFRFFFLVVSEQYAMILAFDVTVEHEAPGTRPVKRFAAAAFAAFGNQQPSQTLSSARHVLDKQIQYGMSLNEENAERVEHAHM